MISFANADSTPLVKSMWKECFNDTEEFVDLYFNEKYEEQNTLIYWVDNKAVASLQMLSYKIRFYDQILPIYYLAGLCTLPDYRNQGIMGKLIYKSFDVMRERKIPLSILIPAEEWLYSYYNKFGFEETFEKGNKPIDLLSILKSTRNSLKDAYTKFDERYQHFDFCVLKNYEDFKTVVKDYIADGYPDKFNLRAMSLIIDPLCVLKAYAKTKSDVSFTLKITDIFENNIFIIKNGSVFISNNTEQVETTFSLSISMLTRLLFGFNINELPQEYQALFDSHEAIINLMLE